jgi:hypothetical protein
LSASQFNASGEKIRRNLRFELPETFPGNFQLPFYGIVGVSFAPKKTHNSNLVVLDLVKVIANDKATGTTILSVIHDLESL